MSIGETPESSRGVGQRVKLARRPVHGVLLLDKPSGITSTAALARAKRALAAAKAGHTGTLDPMASGLLPLCFGEATKFAADLLDADKSYCATLRLGVTTTTGDAEGEVLATRVVDVDRTALEAALALHRGAIAQTPPMYSALKRDGKPLYEYARSGVTLERDARAVEIRRLVATAFDGIDATLEVDCSKGTYIRTLAEDIGAVLGCGAHLIALRRTRVGSLRLSDAIALDTFEARDAAQRDAHLLPLDTLIASLPRIDLDPAMSTRFLHGQRLPLQGAGDCERVRVYGFVDSTRSCAPALLGTAQVRDGGVLAPLRLVLQTSRRP